jgi:ribosome recycling factor
MLALDVTATLEQKMQRLIESFVGNLAKIRTGRAHTGLLEAIVVNYYGNKTPLSQVARLTLLDAHAIGVQPWEKGMVAAIEKAIREAGLGLNPAVQGELIRVPTPLLTQERRQELSKVVRHEGESARIAARNVRREANDQLKKALKDKLISEDDERRMQTEVQKITDKYIAEIDKLAHAKENDILTV